jgi:transcriptional regulator with XRE-family HTH domain
MPTIGERVRALREHQNLSQGVIEQRCGLLRCYISRVENGHTIPSLETLEKLARALQIPVYQFFYDGSEEPPAIKLANSGYGWGHLGKDARTFGRFRRLLRQMEGEDIKLLIYMAQKLSHKRKLRANRSSSARPEERAY